jgi:hypothetical protein
MLKLSKSTKLSPQEVIKRTVKYFGPEGYGLEVKELYDESAYLVGGGGSVSVTTCAEGKTTSVELVSREWDYQVKEFVEKLK